jgi:hypothetical protein
LTKDVALETKGEKNEEKIRGREYEERTANLIFFTN